MATTLTSGPIMLAANMDVENLPPPMIGLGGKEAFAVHIDSCGGRTVSHQAASNSSILIERPFGRQNCSSCVGGLAKPVVVDIDANNGRNPQACAEYAHDIFDHLHEVEGECRPDPRYMETVQADMTPHMRAILVDWLVEVALEYRLCSDTLHLTVALLDRFLSAAPVPRDQLQLAGIACMWAAAKYEEIYAPSAREFCFITDNTYAPDQLVAMEAKVLAALNFRLSLPTAKAFLRRYLQASAADERLHFLASYLCELSLMDDGALARAPSSVAAGSVFLARAMLGLAPWDATLAHYARRSAAEAAAAAALVAANHRRVAEEGAFTAVSDKYASPKLLAVGRAAPIAPAHMAALVAACGSGGVAADCSGMMVA